MLSVSLYKIIVFLSRDGALAQGFDIMVSLPLGIGGSEPRSKVPVKAPRLAWPPFLIVEIVPFPWSLSNVAHTISLRSTISFLELSLTLPLRDCLNREATASSIEILVLFHHQARTNHIGASLWHLSKSAGLFSFKCLRDVPMSSRYYFHGDHYTKKSENCDLIWSAIIKEPGTLPTLSFLIGYFHIHRRTDWGQTLVGLHRYISYEK